MRVLTFSTLFPNEVQPAHGVFVENRLRHLIASGAVEAKVVAPVPWVPADDRLFGEKAALARIGGVETRHGLVIHHPRYPVIPKLGMTLAPTLLYLASRRFVTKLLAETGDIDLIDAHYFYPDGVAAVMLGRHLGKPVVVTARGTDLNLIPRYAVPRRQIQWAARRAAGLVTVCRALKDVLVGLGVDADRVRVLRNGVDLTCFRPMDREAARRCLGVEGRLLLSVGLLIPRKGHDITIRALPDLPDTTLLIVGGGPERHRLEALAGQLGVADRVRFAGPVSHDHLPAYYAAADALILASSREGWANVLLEAMACGTPVVATDIWGTGEVVAEPAAGLLVQQRTPAAIAEAVRRLWANPPDRAATRRYAERFSWDATTAGQVALFTSILKCEPAG